MSLDQSMREPHGSNIPLPASDATPGRAAPAAGFATDRASLTATLSLVVLGVAGLVLLLLTVTSPNELLYDEPWYVRTVSLVHDHGFTVEFLRSLPGLAGPLYTVVQWIFEPLTGRQPPGVRLVNVGFMVLTVVSLYGALRYVPTPSRRVAALSLLAVPMTWVMGGLALTEFTAMALATLGTLCLLAALFRPGAVPGAKPASLALALLGGLLFGAAILGRQPLLVVLGALPFLLIGAPIRLRLPQLVVFGLPAATMALATFVIWGGLVPPAESYSAWGGDTVAMPDAAISIPFGLLGLGYAAVVVMLLAPGFLRMSWKLVAGVLVAALLLNAFGFLRITPIGSVAARIMGPGLLGVYGYVAASAIIALGIVLLIAMFRAAWARREDPVYVFFCIAALLCIASIAGNTSQFSSRYVGTLAPFLIPAIAPSLRGDGWAPLRFAVGATLGALSLLSYYAYASA